MGRGYGGTVVVLVLGWRWMVAVWDMVEVEVVGLGCGGWYVTFLDCGGG